ncbi:MAG TPA: zf-HC2 domain-containing protein, partial [Pyrinomonadaceae bacterium]
MREENEQTGSCRRAETAAAYLDGELDAAEALLFESHLRECSVCAAALLEQRRLLCLLDTAFAAREEACAALPKDFARVVTARAQTDMSGLRSKSEHRTALKICAALTVA